MVVRTSRDFWCRRQRVIEIPGGGGFPSGLREQSAVLNRTSGSIFQRNISQLGVAQRIVRRQPLVEELGDGAHLMIVAYQLRVDRLIASRHHDFLLVP